MAAKRMPTVQEPAAPSVSEEKTSSGEETEAEDESAASSDEDLGQPKTSVQPPAKQISKKPEPEADSDFESDPESGSQSDPLSVSEPIASKPIENKKPESNLPPSPFAEKKTPPSEKRTPSKRRSSQIEPDQTETKRSEKRSKNKGVDQPSGSENAGGRVWSVSDELRLLEGLINFRDEKKTDPGKNMESFLEYIKKHLTFDVSLSQLKDKVSRLRRKYKKMKEEEGLKPRNRRAYDLWRRMWGNTVENSTIKSKNGNAGGSVSKKEKLEAQSRDLRMDVNEDGGDKMEIQAVVGRELNLKEMVAMTHIAGLEDFLVNSGLNSLGAEDRAKMEGEWEKVYVENLKLYIKRNEILNQQAKLMLGKV